LLHTLCTVIQIISAIVLVVLMAIQTDKAQQGGVMGLGGAGARSTGTIDMAVGAERILKPFTRWTCGAFFTFSVLAAIQPNNMHWYHVVIGLVVYILAMMFGGKVWQTITGMRSAQ